VRVQCAVDRSVIGMSRAVAEWMVEMMRYEGKLCLLQSTDKALTGVVS